LFSGIFGFKASHFLSVIASQFVNLFNERVDFLIFQGQLCVQDFELSVLLRNGCVKIMELCLGIFLNFFHRSGVMFEIDVFGRFKWNYFLAEHFDGLFLVNRYLFVFAFNSLVFDVKEIVLSSQGIVLFFEPINFFLMGSSHFIKLLIVRIKIFFVLSLKPVDGLEQFDFGFSLNEEDFILKSLDVGLESILKSFIVLHELFVSSNDELDLWIFGRKGVVKVANFIHETFLNVVGQLPDVFDSGLCLGNQVSSDRNDPCVCGIVQGCQLLFERIG
jgi:hypothetical protein